MIRSAAHPAAGTLVALLVAGVWLVGAAGRGGEPSPRTPEVSMAGILEADPRGVAEAGGALVAAARAEAGSLARRGPPYSAEDAWRFLSIALVDAERFAAGGELRARVLDLLPRALPASAPPELRDRVLYELATGPGLTFDQSEALRLAWGGAQRASAERQIALHAGGLTFPDEILDPIVATIYSLPSRFFARPEVERFLTAVRDMAPDRKLVVLADLPLRRQLEGLARGLDLHLIETFGRPYSPWPRDPFSVARRQEGLVLVARPGAQAQREGDQWMAREVVQNLAPELDRSWGEVTWGWAPFFFHNGHVILTHGAAWTSLHGLERRILEILGLERVPVASFARPEGIDLYLAAAREAMDEASAFYGKPVRLVHPLPEAGDSEERFAAMTVIGGGAGFDLDSLITFLPGAAGQEGGVQALVGDLAAGRDLLAALPPEERRALRDTYRLTPPAEALPGLLAGAQSGGRAAGLAGFLDLVARHLSASGITVRRLPLLVVPVALLEDRERFDHQDFLLGWHNVVIEPGAGGVLAEGFSSGLPAGDRRARELYRQAGVELWLLPPLIQSVVANGGYRCASNQIRLAPQRSAASEAR